MIPWFLVDLIGALAWRIGFDTRVVAQGGPGFHRGRFGADGLSFTRRAPGAQPLPTLRRVRLQPVLTPVD